MSATSDSNIELDTVSMRVRDGAATIELNRPQALNAWNVQLGIDLLAALRQAEADEAIRALVLTGAGRAFSSGADLKDVSGGETTPEGRPDVQKTLTERYHPIMRLIRDIPKPVIASVNGPAVGIGCSLALCSDLILASESAYFLLAFVNIGLVPDGGSSLFVPTRIGMARATELSMLGGCRRRRHWSGDSSTAWWRTTSSLRRRRSSPRNSPAAPRAPTRAPSASSTTGCIRGWTSSWSWRRRFSRKWPQATTFWRARWRSSRSVRHGFRGAENARDKSH
jgi:hypothetical protein